MRYLPKAGETVVYEEIFIPDVEWLDSLEKHKATAALFNLDGKDGDYN